MADEPNESDIRAAQMILAGAIAAAGKCESTVAWRGRINTMIPEIADMMGARSPQIRRALAVKNADVFIATYIGYDTEYTTHDGKPDRSNRWQVKLVHPVDQTHPDGIQRIRTERMDTQPGKSMANKLEQLKEGDEVICWKVQEDTGGGGGRTMAVLYHIRFRPPLKDGGGGQAPLAPRPAPEEGNPSPSSGANPEMDAFNEATKDWPGKTKAALVNDLKFADLFPPNVGNVDRMLAFIRDWSFE